MCTELRTQTNQKLGCPGPRSSTWIRKNLTEGDTATADFVPLSFLFHLKAYDIIHKIYSNSKRMFLLWPVIPN